MTVWFRFSISAGIMALLAVVIAKGWFGMLSSGEQLQALLQQRGLGSYLLLLVICSLFKAFGGPRQLVAVALGYANGALLGLVLTLLTSAIALTIAYYLSCSVLRPFINRMFGSHCQKMAQWLAVATVRKVLLIRLLPVGSNLLTNIVAGAVGIHYGRFLAGSMLGYLPQTLIFVLIGSGVGFAAPEQIMISVLVLVAATAIGWHLYKTRNRILNVEGSSV